MQRPRIGIPLCLDDRGRWRAGRSYHYLDAAYASAIEEAGGLVQYLPIQAGGAEALIAGVDGLLLPGGDDLPPEPGDAPLPSGVLDLAPEAQVEFDRALAQAAFAQERPVLGICYGMQLLARLRGGQLEAHLPTQRPGPVSHTSHPTGTPQAHHSVRIAPESQLARILGPGPLEVNSLHHQGIRALAAPHRAVAWSDDGLIEAFEAGQDETRQGKPLFEIGVQWHPEKLGDPASRRLFAALIAACKSRLDS